MTGTATDRIRHALQDEIADARLPPGQALDEAALARRFQVSRTPVREALLQLAVQGFVRVLPRAGIFVAALDLRELTDLSETLAHLDGLCAGLACQRMRTPERRKLAALLQSGRQARDEGDTARYAVLDENLHNAIYQNCDNPFLMRQVQLIRRRTQPYRIRHLDKQPERLRQSHQEHDEIVTAILDDTPQAAAEAASRHVLNASRHLNDLASRQPEALWPSERAKRARTPSPDAPRLTLDWVFSGEPAA
ncbi:MAG TPA: GntR family transcriptional regulator [Bordetella sp.]